MVRRALLEYSFDLVHQSADIEWLVDEGVHACALGRQTVARLRATHCHQDRRSRERGLVFQRSRDIDPTLVGKAHVQDDQIGLDAASEQDPGLSVASLDDTMTSSLDRQAKQKAGTGIVFANKDRGSSS